MAYREYIEEVIKLAEPEIKRSEGKRLHAYPDPATHGEPYTIGWGHTGGVRPTDTITDAQAEQLLQADMRKRLVAMLHHLEHTPKPHESAAMLSFVFNLGLGAFYHSTLLAKFNAGDIEGAANEFPRWNKAAGHVMKGLTARRERERKLFLGETDV